jgi:hypothetical protein
VDVLALDLDGNAIVVATDIDTNIQCEATMGFRVLRLAHDDGMVVAEHALLGEAPATATSAARFGRGEGGAVSPSGDVLVAGIQNSLEDQFVTARLTGPNLQEAWRRTDPFWHAAPGSFAAHAAIVGPGDRLVIPGAVGGKILPVPIFAAPTVFSVLSLNADGGALDACGDARRDSAERRDDGLAEGGCCAPDCAAAVPDGTACDDFDACTVGDQCADASCRGTAPLPCAPCGTCDPRLGCIPDVSMGRISPRPASRWTTSTSRYSFVAPTIGQPAGTLITP